MTGLSGPKTHLRAVSRRPALAIGVVDVFSTAAIHILFWADRLKQGKAEEAGLL